jgi:hypothetical protein
MIDWKPIETAPEEGAWALVYAEGAINCAFVKRGRLPEDFTLAACWNIIPEFVTHWARISGLQRHGKARQLSRVGLWGRGRRLPVLPDEDRLAEAGC